MQEIMTNENEMPRKTISMSKEESDKLDFLSKTEHRPVSQQIVYMMEFYIKNKKQ